MDFSLEEKLHNLRELSARYATAEAQRVYLDHFRRSQMAILMKACAHLHKSANAQEREALADKAYLTTLLGLKAATEEAERLRWELRIAMAEMELWRTKQANERAERKGYGA